MFTKSLIIATIASVAVARSTWHECAVEGGSCTCESGNVRYGAVQKELWGQTRHGMNQVRCNSTTFQDVAIGIEKICQCEEILAPHVRRTFHLLDEGDATESSSSANVAPVVDAIKREWDKGFVTPKTWAAYVANNTIHQAKTKELRQARATAAIAYINAEKAAVADSASLDEAAQARQNAILVLHEATTAANEASSANEKAITKASDAKTAMDKATKAETDAKTLAGTNNGAANAAATTANAAQAALVSTANKKAADAKTDMTAAGTKHTDAVAHEGSMKTMLDDANTTLAGAKTKLSTANAAVVTSRKAAEDAHKAFVAHTKTSAETGNF